MRGGDNRRSKRLPLTWPSPHAKKHGEREVSPAVLALADLAEDLPLGFADHAEALLNGRHVWTQERVGLEFQIHARRQRRLAGSAQGIDLLGALLQRCIVRLDGE